MSILNPRLLHHVSSKLAHVLAAVTLTYSQLSFSDPAAYHEIYNGSNRWDKEPTLYQSFGQDHSTFGCLKYADSKTRRDILGPMFSRKAVSDYQGLIQTNVRLCSFISLHKIRNNFSG